MFLILFIIIYCNIHIKSLLFSYNKFSRFNTNFILKAKYNSNYINPKHILINDHNMPTVILKLIITI